MTPSHSSLPSLANGTSPFAQPSSHRSHQTPPFHNAEVNCRVESIFFPSC
ncbi:unnamed protein product [Chondrus crispus]|uniref:Uncharacterized protein n=1 Tax=Chondrus crispus TaxID=2769 RepID=R7QU72_CHOCR|nr:unnamed protein product [Chondrus crispus]CDF40905.1 unnamed protein product [Chondrus crispus]|eukprot:XP_005711199.1 unnamed protein product [Chondrus crispus]